MLRRLMAPMVGSLMGLAVAGSIALATDDKTYAGAACVKEGTAGVLEADLYGRAFNRSSTATLTVICPVVRDDTGGAFDGGRATVIDQHYSQNVTCSLVNYSEWGPGWNGYISRTTSGSSPSPMVLNFSGANNIDSNAYYAMRCVIPPTYSGNASGVWAYKVME